MIAPELVTSPAPRIAPGPRSYPIIGNPGVLRGLLPFLEQQWKRYGDVTRLQLGGVPATLVTHPELVQEILLTKRENFVKGPAYAGVRKLLGNGLIALEGDAWKTRRTLVQPAFHRPALEKLTAVMVDSGARFFDRAILDASSQAQVVNIHHMFVRLTLDVVIAALFGEGTLDSGQVSYETLSSTLEILSDNFNGFRLPEWIPTPRNRRFKRVTRDLDRNVYAIIESARRGREQGGAGSLLAMLLDARDETGAELPDAELRNEVLTLFIAGHETTALTLTWLFALLDGRVDVVERIRDEIDAVLGGRDPSFEDIAKLTYVRQVVDETLRIRPVAPMVPRNVVDDDVIGGCKVARGEMVLSFFWGLHRHPDFWSRPEYFDPDRFGPNEGKLRHKWSYLPFSAGPRVCIGNQFSLIESVVLLAQLFNRFDVEVQSGAEVKPVAVGTVRPSHPVRVKLKRRCGN